MPSFELHCRACDDRMTSNKAHGRAHTLWTKRAAVPSSMQDNEITASWKNPVLEDYEKGDRDVAALCFRCYKQYCLPLSAKDDDGQGSKVEKERRVNSRSKTTADAQIVSLRTMKERATTVYRPVELEDRGQLYYASVFQWAQHTLKSQTCTTDKCN